MHRKHEDHLYTTRLTNDRKNGCAFLELCRTSNGEEKLVAKIIFWDAAGQFFLESVVDELPLDVVQEFIVEARAAIKTR